MEVCKSMTDPSYAIVFDLDGTLHDASAWWHSTIVGAINDINNRKSINLRIMTHDEVLRLIGATESEFWEEFWKDRAAVKPNMQIIADLQDLIFTCAIDRVGDGTDYLYPGTRTLLAHIRKCGISIAVVSNANEKYFDAVLDGQGLRPLIDFASCIGNKKAETKADLVSEFVKSHGVEISSVVGDTQVDLEMAKDIGVPFIWRAGVIPLPVQPNSTWHGESNELLQLLNLPPLSL